MRFETDDHDGENVFASKENYEAGIVRMAESAKNWKNHNALLNITIQFNYPRNVMVAAGIREAIKASLITADPGGHSLLAAMIAGTPDATVMMIRTALDLAFPPDSPTRGGAN